MKKYLYLLLLLFTIVTGFYFFWSWAQLPAGHRYIYSLDDVYIHLALARNFAELGVWSVNTSGFDSASSSILYTLLLSFLIKVFGDWEYYPLIINIVFGYFTIYGVYRYFKDFYGKRELEWTLFLLLPFSLLYVMALVGMEHTLHMFLMVMAIYFIHKNVKSDCAKKDFSVLLVVVFFLSIVRFESMFFTVSLGFALFLKSKFKKGFLVLITGFLPILIFGLISQNQGGYFFPNSVMIKGSFPGDQHFLYSSWQLILNGIVLNSSFYKCFFFPFVLILIYLFKKHKGVGFMVLLQRETLIITIVCTAVLQSLFAFLKYRYENYLMIAILIVIIPLIVELTKDFSIKKMRFSFLKWLTLGCITIIIAVSGYRFGFHHLPLKMSSKGINDQQIEMSRFLGMNYKGEKVVANDIGAISYFSHVQLLDLVGLGSTEVAHIKVEYKHQPKKEFESNYRKFITQFVAENNYRVAVIYPEWFPGSLPSNWIPVASWTLKDGSYGPAIPRVVFYALNSSEVVPLQTKLSNFNLSENVEQWFYIHQKK